MKLENCPFCDNAAESDSCQGYRNYTTGRIENQVAIYCTVCSAQLTMCHSDFPDMEIGDMLDRLASEWNTRANPRAKLEEALREIDRLREFLGAIQFIARNFKSYPSVESAFDKIDDQVITSIAAKALEENSQNQKP